MEQKDIAPIVQRVVDEINKPLDSPVLRMAKGIADAVHVAVVPAGLSGVATLVKFTPEKTPKNETLVHVNIIGNAPVQMERTSHPVSSTYHENEQQFYSFVDRILSNEFRVQTAAMKRKTPPKPASE